MTGTDFKKKIMMKQHTSPDEGSWPLERPQPRSHAGAWERAKRTSWQLMLRYNSLF